MLRIVEAKKEDRDIMMNLLEKYLYEFSQWEKTDVNDNGLYGYEYLDCYFEENNRYPYLIKVDEKIAGLILISDYPEVPEESTDFCLSEFFIMHKYRRVCCGDYIIPKKGGNCSFYLQTSNKSRF